MENNLQTRIDTIREEFQDARPDVVMLIDFMAQLIDEQRVRILELLEYKTMYEGLCK